MSYSLTGSIVDATSKKVLVKLCDVSFLKNLNDRRYSCSFEHINSLEDKYSKDFPSVVSYDSYEYYVAVKKEILEKLPSAKRFKSNGSAFDFEGYVTELSEIESLGEDAVKELSMDAKVLFEMFQDKSKKLPDDVINLYAHTVAEENGLWFDKKSFENGLVHYEKRLNEAKEKLNRLNAIKNGKDYYEMSEDGRNNLLEDISYAEDDLDELTYQVESIKKIIDVLDFYENDYAFEVEDSDGLDYADRYTWSYSDKRDIKIFISVS